MKKYRLFAILGAVVILGLIVHWPRSQRAYDIPLALTAEQLSTLPDQQLVFEATSEVRWSMADVAPSDIPKFWRTLPEPARHLLTLSWLESDNGPGDQPVFTGFANLLANTAAHAPTLAEVSAAYSAVGATDAAAVVDEAEQMATAAGYTPGEPSPEGKNPFGNLDRKLRQKSLACNAARLLRAYVRAHISEIAAVRTTR